MRKLIFLCSLIVLFAITTYAQNTTMTIGQVQASVGQQVTVPINVQNFFNVGSITLKIQYDPNVLTFDDVINEPTGVNFAAGASNGVINISWAGLNAITIENGKLADIQLTYKGGNGNLNFNTAQCELTNSSGTVITGISYVNGGVSINPVEAVTIELAKVTATSNSNIELPLTVKNFNDVGSITLKIQYDPAVVTFNSVKNAPTGVDFAAGASNGVINISWAGLTAINIADGKLLDLDLTYKSGTSDLAFNVSQCEITNSSGSVISGISYIDGKVEINPVEAVEVKLGSVEASVNSDIELPLTVKNFNDVGSITLKIQYDPAVVTFNSVKNAPTGVDFAAGASNGVINISWAGLTAINIADGKLLDLDLTYINGTSDFAFNVSECEITNSSGSVISGISYVDGKIEINPTEAVEVKLGSVQVSANSNIELPLTVKNFNDVGSITLKIQYDPAVVTFNSVKNAPTGVDFAAGASNGVINISWAGLTAINIADGKLLDLDLTYISGTSDLAFNDSECEITNSSGSVISGISYVDGKIEINPIEAVEVKLDNVQASANSNIELPLTVKNFNDVGSITLKIQYDPSVVTFNSVKNAPTGVDFAAGASNGVINISWAGLTPINIADGKLLDLDLTYVEGATELIFVTAQCEITNSTGVVIGGITYGNGSVFPIDAEIPVFQLPNLAELLTTEIAVPLLVKKLQNIGAITLKIAYDDLALTFKGITNSQTGVDILASADNGVINLSWAGLNSINLDSADLLEINFTFQGGNSPLTFLSAQCEIVDSEGKVVPFVQYIDGSVAGNKKPVFTNVLQDTTVAEADTLVFQFVAEDVNIGTELTYSLGAGPEGSSIDPLSGEFSWVPGYALATRTEDYIDTVVVVVSDGVLSDTTSAIVTVENTNRAPVFTATLPDQTINRNDPFTFQYEATDPDADTLTYSMLGGPSGASITVDGLFSWTPTPQDSGDHTIYIQVTDGLIAIVDTVGQLTVNVKRVPGIPTKFDLSQNYPNPFNPSTRIKYAIPEESKVVVSIYNLLGQEIAVLVNEVQSAGNYVVDFNASNLTTGMYLYKIEANDYTSVKKMILMK